MIHPLLSTWISTRQTLRQIFDKIIKWHFQYEVICNSFFMNFDAFLTVFYFTQFWLDGRPGNETPGTPGCAYAVI